MQIGMFGYGLYHNKEKKILGVSVDINCDSNISYTLSNDSDMKWVVDKLTASYVRLNSTEWYNAKYEMPINPYNPEDLDVISIEIKFSIEEPVKIPTFEEYMMMKYNTKGEKSYSPDHYNIIMDELKRRGHKGKYSIYDLRILEMERDV
jgi:hypothetical protein